MRKRWRWVAAALAGLAVVLAVGVVALWPESDRITLWNYQRLQGGMTRAEVEEILGPPGDFRTETKSPVYGPKWLKEPRTAEMWLTDDSVILVWFDASQRVKEKWGHSRGDSTPEPFRTIKRWWRRCFP